MRCRGAKICQDAICGSSTFDGPSHNNTLHTLHTLHTPHQCNMQQYATCLITDSNSSMDFALFSRLDICRLSKAQSITIGIRCTEPLPLQQVTGTLFASIRPHWHALLTVEMRVPLSLHEIDQKSTRCHNLRGVSGCLSVRFSQGFSWQDAQSKARNPPDLQ